MPLRASVVPCHIAAMSVAGLERQHRLRGHLIAYSHPQPLAFGFCVQEYCFALRGALGTVALIAISLCCTCAEGTRRLTRAMAGATFNFLPGLNSGG